MADTQAIETAVRRAIVDELERLGLELVAAVVRYINENNINVSGDLRKTVAHFVSEELRTIRLTVGSGVAYDIFVHEPTRPHWAPIEPLRVWVRKKLGITDVDEISRVARLVQFKIARKGTEGQPFLAMPFKLFRNTIAARIGEAIKAEFGQ